MSIIPAIQLLSIEQMSQILFIKPNTMHSRKWQQKSGCPLRKQGRRLYALSQEFNDWLADSHKLNV